MKMKKKGKYFLEKGTRCLLIQPKFFPLSFWNYNDVCKIRGVKYPASPLGLVTVAALLPPQWEYKLIDENVEPILDEYYEWADLVCTGGMRSQKQGILNIIDKAHQAGCPVVVGGPEPTAYPGMYCKADFLVTGEGEATIPIFIEDLEKRVESGEYKSSEKADMHNAVIPRFDLINFKDYMHVGVQYSRGCPYNCEFCDAIEIFGRKSRTKNSEQIIKELQSLYDFGYRGHVDFVDDNFIGNKNDVKETLQVLVDWYQIRNNPFYFSTETSLDLADDSKLLQLMRDVDFRYVYIGIETPEDEILRLINKSQNIDKDIITATKKIQSYGMLIFASFIIGFDDENNRTSQNMIKCIEDAGLCMIMLGKLEALPNTQLSKRLQNEDRFLFYKQNGLQAISENANAELCRDYWCCASGLNFSTIRSRLDILKDYIEIFRNVYNPENYFNRIINSCLDFNPSKKYKPNVYASIGLITSFLKSCKKLGFNKTTGWLYWKVLLNILIKNPRALETAVSLAVMFIHFYNQSRLITETTNKEITYIRKYGEEKYFSLIFQ
jgi:radical SAM superfamily enzyme YgiQ (UPF0313 family)